MSDDPESGGSGGGGTVNYNNNYAPSSLKDDNDENKYRTKDKLSFLPPGTPMRQLFLFLFTQKKARVAFEIVRFFVVAMFFRLLIVKVVFEDGGGIGNEDEDHPGSLLSTTTTRGVGKSYKNNNKYHPLFDGEDNMFPFPEYDNLVIVTGHSVYSGSDYMRAGEENSWFLEEYQICGNSKRFGRTD